MPKHFTFGGSALARILACPGSVAHLTKHPLPDTEYTKAGTNAHDLAQQICEGADPFELEGSAADMEFAEGYAEYIQSVVDEVRKETGEEPVVVFEKQYGTEIEGEMVGGTPDCLVYVDGGPLHVIDAKHGFKYVDPEHNYQLRCYAYAVVEELGLFIESFTAHVYQPNSLGDPTKRSEEGVDWMEHWHNVMVGMITEAKKKDATMITGDHCSECFCNKAQCPLWQQQVSEGGLSVSAIKTELPKLEEAEATRLLRIMELAPVVASMAKEAAGILSARAQAGDQIPGMKLVKQIGSRTWATGTPGPIPMAKKLGIAARDFYAEPKLVGPAPIEKAIKAAYKGKERKQYLEILDTMVERPDKGVKLVSSKAKGEAVSVSFDESDDVKELGE